jgi:uncharacterized membrane protein YeaQ/YmgE (transglycosylase-associated protein family)
MSLIDVVLVLVIAFVCGSVAQAIAGGTRGGCLVTIAVGFIGAMLGTWIARQMDLPKILEIQGFPVVWSIMGGALFSAAIGWLSRQRRM